MEVMKVFSDLYDEERIYSVLMDEDEMNLYQYLFSDDEGHKDYRADLTVSDRVGMWGAKNLQRQGDRDAWEDYVETGSTKKLGKRGAKWGAAMGGTAGLAAGALAGTMVKGKISNKKLDKIVESSGKKIEAQVKKGAITEKEGAKALLKMVEKKAKRAVKANKAGKVAALTAGAAAGLGAIGAGAGYVSNRLGGVIHREVGTNLSRSARLNDQLKNDQNKVASGKMTRAEYAKKWNK